MTEGNDHCHLAPFFNHATPKCVGQELAMPMERATVSALAS